MYKKQSQLMEIAVCLLDMGAVVCSLAIAEYIRYQRFGEMTNIGTLSVFFLLHIAAFYALHVYEDFFKRGRYRELFVSFRYNVLLVAEALILGFGLKREIFISRLVFGYFLVVNTSLIWALHIVIRNSNRFFQWSRRKEVNLLLVTTKDYLPEIVRTFERSKETVWKIAGAILLDGGNAPEIQLGEEIIPIIPADEESYLEYATGHVVDEVFIRVDAIQEREHFLKEMILEFEKMGVTVDLNLDLFNLGISGEKRIYSMEKYHVVSFSSRLFDYRMVFLKRVMDIVGALIGLVVTVLVGIVLAPFLLLDSPGPLIFCQKRVGVNGRTFNFYKFRSMYADAENRKAELMKENEVQGLMFKMENDPRVTKVGAFIRRTSLDELPQFWNVLKGDMSLVGTRPPTLDEYEKYSYYQKRRISFRPGITGLWQISGRSDIKDFDEVVKLDLEYIDNWSLYLDVKIILKTIGVVFRGSGAR